MNSEIVFNRARDYGDSIALARQIAQISWPTAEYFERRRQKKLSPPEA